MIDKIAAVITGFGIIIMAGGIFMRLVNCVCRYIVEQIK